MTRPAILPTDMPAVMADVNTRMTARQHSASRQEFFQPKRFEELSSKEKDRLLKFIALRLGLLQESRDE